MLPGHPPRSPSARWDLPLETVRSVVIDLETTGLHPHRGDRVIEMAAVLVDGLEVRKEPMFDQMVNPGRRSSPAAFRVHRIRDEELEGKPSEQEVIGSFMAFLDDRVIVGHNVAFDLSFLVRILDEAGLDGFHSPVLDTRWLSRLLYPDQRQHSLDAVAARVGVPIPANRHRALGDALLTAEVFVALVRRYLAQHPGGRLGDLCRACERLEAGSHGAPEVVEELRRAAREHRVVEMAYLPAGRLGEPAGAPPRPRRVAIYHLEPPYLVGYCYRQHTIQTFRTDRIVSAQCLETRFEIPDGFHPHDHFLRWA